VRRLLPLPLPLLLVAGPVVGQEPAPPHMTVAAIAPRPADVESLDGILAAFYDVISGPAGQPRQWARDRTLYIPDVRFVSLSTDSAGHVHAAVMDHQTFVDRSNDALVARGFYEQEIHRTVQRFGNVVHVFSTYEMRAREDGPAFGRGINSIELFWDGRRWWIASAQWDDERPGNPIPSQYLPKH
jgi:hypothetical protein